MDYTTLSKSQLWAIAKQRQSETNCPPQIRELTWQSSKDDMIWTLAFHHQHTDGQEQQHSTPPSSDFHLGANDSQSNVANNFVHTDNTPTTQADVVPQNTVHTVESDDDFSLWDEILKQAVPTTENIGTKTHNAAIKQDGNIHYFE